MDAIKQLQETASYVEEIQWERRGCSREGTYICQAHKSIVICNKCKDLAHSECQVTEYHSPYDLSSLAWELNVILVHVDSDCAHFIDEFKVEEIRLQLINHLKDVGNLTKRVLSWLKLGKAEYRK